MSNEELDGIAEALRAWEVPEPPTHFADGVLSALGAKKPRSLRERLRRATAGSSGGSPSGAVMRPPFVPPEPEAAPAEARRAPLDEPPMLEELGTRKPYFMMAGAAALLAVGLGVGFGVSGTIGERSLHNATIRDVRAVHAAIESSSRTVAAASEHVAEVVGAASGDESAGAGPVFAFAAVDALGALEQPFEAAAFTNRNYNALPPAAVNDLFRYLMNVDLIWRRIGELTSSMTAQRRAALDRYGGGEMTGRGMTRYGAVLWRPDGGPVIGSLVTIEPAQRSADGASSTVVARAPRGGGQRELQIYGGEEIEAEPRYVLVLDQATNRRVEGEAYGTFERFVEQIRELDTLLERTMVIQGRLLRALGEVAALDEV